MPARLRPVCERQPGAGTRACGGGTTTTSKRARTQRWWLQLKGTGYATRPNAWLGGVGLARASGGTGRWGKVAATRQSHKTTNAARSRAPASGVSWTVLGWIGTWSEAGAWGCAGSFGGVALAGTGPTAAEGEEELDEAEELDLDAEPRRCAGGSGRWTAGAGASVDVAAGGALACCTTRSSDAAASLKTHAAKLLARSQGCIRRAAPRNSKPREGAQKRWPATC